MSFQEIIQDLESRGEYNITLRENGIITSKHGQYTHNFWIVQNNKLVCIDCKTF